MHLESVAKLAQLVWSWVCQLFGSVTKFLMKILLITQVLMTYSYLPSLDPVLCNTMMRLFAAIAKITFDAT